MKNEETQRQKDRYSRKKKKRKQNFSEMCSQAAATKAENNREEPKEVDRQNESEMLGEIFITRREVKSSDRERKSVRMLMYVASISCICVRVLCTLKRMRASTRHTGGE